MCFCIVCGLVVFLIGRCVLGLLWFLVERGEARFSDFRCVVGNSGTLAGRLRLLRGFGAG